MAHKKTNHWKQFWIILFYSSETNILRGNEVRFNSKICKRDKSFISIIYFLYTLLALKRILFRHFTNILRCSLPETGNGMAVVNFSRLSLALYCIFVISVIKSYPCLRWIKSFSLLVISYECWNGIFYSQWLDNRSGLGTKLQAPVHFLTSETQENTREKLKLFMDWL